ncbi:COP9 signalosome complex subunit 12 [Trichodelitschia bisporula]|uniref:Protein CSN12 homolog n=1 Tax=Trichodelitschia bisporula TaxID=703511 RepID=A0A6G1HZZ5_9PEZI|nr:COP9 signalosome complex subunit 12 [Trichodelitschia bisporula]
MEVVLGLFKRGMIEQNGHMVADALTPIAPPRDTGRLYAFYRASSAFSIQADLRHEIVYSSDIHLNKAESNAWIDVFVAYWKAVGALLATEEATNQGKAQDAEWGKAYEQWKEMVNALIRGYTTNVFPPWTLPCLYTAGKYLRNLAIKADEQTRKSTGNVTYNEGFQDDVVSSIGKNDSLQDAARQINRIFSLCISDRAPLEESRKWGVYYISNLLFKIYFKLNSISLCKNILRSLQVSQSDMPPFEGFPKSHQVTFRYYAGVIHFLDEDYKTAEDYLTKALTACHRTAHKNQELILTYLIPCRLLTASQLPTPTVLAQFPHLEALFTPLITAMKQGNLAAFDAALVAGEPAFIKRRIYLTLERGRDMVLRNLLRKVFIAGGFEPVKEGAADASRVRRTRIPVKEFWAAVRLSSGPVAGEHLEVDEVECMLANLIYKGFIKGYISREFGKVVLSKNNQAFPGTGV